MNNDDGTGSVCGMRDENEILRERVQQLEEQVAQISSWLGSELGFNTATIGNVGRHIEDIRKNAIRNTTQIYGNGKEGLVTRVSVLENDKLRTNAGVQNMIAIVSVFVAIVAVIVAMIAS